MKGKEKAKGLYTMRSTPWEVGLKSTCYTRIKDKKHMINSIDAETKFNRSPTYIHNKGFQQTRDSYGNIFNLIKGIDENPTTNIFNSERSNTFLPKRINKANMFAFATSAQHCIRGSC